MAIIVDVRQDKRKSGNKLWYGKAWHPQILDTRALAARVQENVSVKESDVYAVLIELANVLTYEMQNGSKCQLDRFGYFYPQLRSTGAVTKEDYSITDNIKDTVIKFTPFYTRDKKNAAPGKTSGLSSRALDSGFKYVLKDKVEETEPEP